MKRKYILIPLIAGAAVFSSCKEKNTPASSSGGGDPGGKTEEVAPAPDPIKPTASAADRAAKLGFAKNLPKDILSYEAVYNGRRAFDKFLNTSIGKFVLERMADEGVKLDDLTGNDEMAVQLAMYGEEYFAAYGDGTPEAFSLALQFLERAAYYSARTGIFAADAQIRDGNFDPDSPKVLLDGPLKGAPKELLKMFADFQMPTFYQGAKVSDADSRDTVAGMMAEAVSVIGLAEEASEAITIKRGNHEFTGFKLSGAKLAELMDKEDLTELEQLIDAADITAFKESLAKKNIVAVSGVVGDYVVMFFGKSADDFVLVDNVEDSVCANPKMAYLDSYLDKDILIAGYSDSKMTNNVSSVSRFFHRMVSATANGAAKGLGEATSLGDTRDVEALLTELAKQGESLAGLFSTTDAGYVVYLEDGVKAESYGGPNLPEFDFGKTHTFSPMEAGEGTLLFANWTDNESYNQKVLEYIDTLGETSYLVAKRVAALDIDDGDFRDFKQGLEMFDGKFRADALELWKALRVDLAAGLGAESAVVVDVNGSFPKVPNVPQVVLKEGKVPRIAYVSEVADRAKLQSSWEKINTSAENMLKTISEMQGEEIPMQVPMSSEKNDLKTWFVPIPFQNDDFVPSVSVSDELFFASTSKTFSEGLAERFKQGGGTGRKGAWLDVDFGVLNQYAKQWLKLVEDHAAEVFPNEHAQKDFADNKPKIESALKAFETLERLTMHTRNEGGRTRVSLHLKAN